MHETGLASNVMKEGSHWHRAETDRGGFVKSRQSIIISKESAYFSLRGFQQERHKVQCFFEH